MRLSFTRSDLMTFVLGALAAVLVPLGAALAQLDNDPVTDYSTWAMGLLTGIGAALGRYLATAVPAARVNTVVTTYETRSSSAADMTRASLPPRPATTTVGAIVEKKKRQPPVG